MTGLLDCDSVTWDGVRSAREKATTKATLPLSQTQAAMDTGEAESDTIACLGRGDISILSALTTQLPDVFYGEILPKLDMLGHAQFGASEQDVQGHRVERGRRSIDGAESPDDPNGS